MAQLRALSIQQVGLTIGLAAEIQAGDLSLRTEVNGCDGAGVLTRPVS